MSAENIDTPPVYYEQLDDIEDDFEQVDLEIRKYYSRFLQTWAYGHEAG